MLRRYVEQILNVFNYIDAIFVTNEKCVVEYYVNNRPQMNKLREKDVLGKNILEIYPNLTEETSSFYRVLRTGKPIHNEFQVMCAASTGQKINGINTTIPIKHDGRIIGIVEVTRWSDAEFQREAIPLSLKNAAESEKNPMDLYTVDDIVTCSPQMKEIKNRIKRVAETDSAVMIYGLTGTGKELVAQSIHTASARRKNKFVAQNCAAIPETLLESILFGTTKGSYTGAENRPGLFELANGGTLFLDEINSMEPSMQAKLLKTTEEKKVTRIGGIEPIPVDVKIISATNESPEDCLRLKRIREDLFYRLSVVRLDLPSLVERTGDVLYLAHYFIGYYNKKMQRNVMDISEEVEQLFLSYSWPGNVREMKNIIESAFNLTSSRIIQLQDLPGYMMHRTDQKKDAGFTFALPSGGSLQDRVSAYEKLLIEQALEQSKTLSDAAQQLEISKQGLSYKIMKYGIPYKKNKKDG